MSKMKELAYMVKHEQMHFATALVRYLKVDASMGIENMSRVDAAELVYEWMNGEALDQPVTPHDWIGEALSRREECAALIGQQGMWNCAQDYVINAAIAAPRNSHHKHNRDAYREAVTSGATDMDYWEWVARRLEGEIEDMSTPVIMPARGDAAELRILQLETQLEEVLDGRNKALDDYDLARTEAHNSHQECHRLRNDLEITRECHAKTVGDLAIRTAQLDLVEARLNKYVAAEKKAERLARNQ